MWQIDCEAADAGAHRHIHRHGAFAYRRIRGAIDRSAGHKADQVHVTERHPHDLAEVAALAGREEEACEILRAAEDGFDQRDAVA